LKALLIARRHELTQAALDNGVPIAAITDSAFSSFHLHQCGLKSSKLILARSDPLLRLSPWQ
jgi:hypothetical protein